jgi:hypothetical protein
VLVAEHGRRKAFKRTSNIPAVRLKRRSWARMSAGEDGLLKPRFLFPPQAQKPNGFARSSTQVLVSLLRTLVQEIDKRGEDDWKGIVSKARKDQLACT